MSIKIGTSEFLDEETAEFQLPIGNSELADRAARLKAAVKRAGGNHAVAARAGVPISTLNNHIAGRDMKVATLVALAKASGVNVAWLAAGDGPMTGEQQVQHMAASEPQKSAPVGSAKAFATINVDLMAQALQSASKTFAEAGATPEPRELVQVMLLLYDGMNKP